MHGFWFIVIYLWDYAKEFLNLLNIIFLPIMIIMHYIIKKRKKKTIHSQYKTELCHIQSQTCFSDGKGFSDFLQNLSSFRNRRLIIWIQRKWMVSHKDSKTHWESFIIVLYYSWREDTCILKIETILVPITIIKCLPKKTIIKCWFFFLFLCFSIYMTLSFILCIFFKVS